MSFEAGPSKSLSSSSSSSSSSNPEEEVDFTALIEAQSQLAHAQHRAMLNVYANNNLLMAYYLNQQDSDQPSRGGSIPSHNVIHCGREEAAHNLWADYFAENPRYNEDGLGRLGLSSFQKITSVFRMLAYGVPADSTDEYIKIGESTAIESMKRFCRAVVEVFGERYLRSPNAYDVARLLQIGEERGFPGMLGSLDCMHWKWKNCPTAWAGQYSRRSGSPTIILEAVADYDLWIWHAYFGLPGSNNDINVLEASHLFSNLAKEYNTGYYLANSIYPKWSTLVQTIHDLRGPKKSLFAMKQEACRKDVERAFGVLQSRFAIVKGPARFWNKHVLHDIMSSCIIMHNMIVEDERDVDADIDNWREAPAPEVDMAVDENTRFQQFLARHREIRDKEAHISLRNALIEHLWEQYSNSPNY
ncbi:hypothetical protein ACOSQ4_028843 [Xanthoceras sorbifolium]